MKIRKTLHVTNRTKWRAWLEKNHDSETEAWLVFYKKHTGQLSVAYDDAVEEALCFGWIDGVIQRIDDETYARRFSPRRDGSNWSALNKRRAAKMIEEGRMTEAGAAKLTYSDSEDDYGRTLQRKAEDLIIPEYFEQALTSNRQAHENFAKLAPSYRRRYLLWIADARTDETRDRRVAEAIRLLAENKKLGMT
ncbi:MAG: YdeI/OmpD-associated family protein [Dehalococcoidia bacterium]|nr:YdeI/OmpD-associated family protein [Dehalococcoidia bacterium]